MASAHDADAGDPLKPYVVFILDTSGSMDAGVSGATPSCGGTSTRLNHARCAINKIVNSYGDMVFALGRFRETASGTFASSCPSDCGTSGIGCSACDDNGANGAAVNANCTAEMRSDSRSEMLTGLDELSNNAAAVWTDFTCGSCGGAGTALAAQPEIWGTGSWTPLGGALKGAHRYWQGLQATNGDSIWPSATTGFDPIRNDSTRTVFVPRPGSGSATCNPSPATCNNAGGCTGPNCCCLEQCRPYITILLTDGAETCGGDAPAAATAMLTTDILQAGVTRRYRIETKPIGFGIAAGNGDIEDIAHAGGAADVAGNEGFYASNEAELQLAISAILDDAIKTELCNTLDDDCDTLVDEGFNVGAACDNGQQGVCRRTGNLGCNMTGSGVVCSAPAITPGSEGVVCNSLDDDCDGKIDEGITGCACIPQGETCNNMNDDCDAFIDEGPITRPCGTGTCQGIETCAAGVFGGCTAQPSTTEVCDNIDNDCDGVRDGFTQECSNMPVNGFPAGDPRNNPGANPNDPAPSCLSLGPSVCVCHPGNRSCPPNSGMFGACLGEVTPQTEVCNTLDDDCDGAVDEGTGGQDCSTSCGVGTTRCVAGVITCDAMTAPNDDTCDGNDDDCDMMIDEDYMSPGGCGTGVVCNGMERCINGVETCIGDPIGNESCNCDDDDCDTRVDENVACPTGSTCTNCQCAFPCAGGEFPCPLGKRCENNFCIEDPCFGIDCPMVGADKQVCQVQGNAGVCVTACSLANCTGGTRCLPSTGECLPNTCTSFPELCAGSENCINGVCVSNPCSGVTCDNGQYCVGGTCVSSCSGVECAATERCELGQCVENPCGRACPSGQVCNDDSGTCQPNPCTGAPPCPVGQWCDPNGDGQCADDPCVGTACPDGDQVCIGGTCDDPVLPLGNDAGMPEHVTAGGGGGCATSGGDGGLALVGLALLLGRRRRRASTVATIGGAQ